MLDMHSVQGVWYALHGIGGGIGSCRICAEISDSCTVDWHEVVNDKGGVDNIPPIL